MFQSKENSPATLVLFGHQKLFVKGKYQGSGTPYIPGRIFSTYIATNMYNIESNINIKAT